MTDSAKSLKRINELFKQSIEIKKQCLEQGLSSLNSMGNQISHSIMNGGKLLLCGNGGSAADAQHLAAELLVRLRPMNDRRGVPALSLAQDISTVTACGNDFGFETLYERMVMALGNRGDCLIGITTSGNSENVLRALRTAKNNGIRTFGFLGNKGGAAIEHCDEAFVVPSNNTGRVQEAHITAGHALMEHIEDTLLELGFIKLGVLE